MVLMEAVAVAVGVVVTSWDRSVKVVVEWAPPRNSAITVLMSAVEARSSVSCAGVVTRLVEIVTVAVVVAGAMLGSVDWSLPSTVVMVTCGTVALSVAAEETAVAAAGVVQPSSVWAEHALSSATQTRI